MPRVRLFHWRAAEADAVIESLRSARHEVDYDERAQDSVREMRRRMPDVVVIDLSRLPSRGRDVAAFLRARKTMRHIPIVFVNGTEERVEAIRQSIPDAVYVSVAKLRSAVRQAAANRPVDPVVPQTMMERYATRTTAQKLGIREDSTVAVIDPPRNYDIGLERDTGVSEWYGPPDGVPADITLWFVHDAAACIEALPDMRKIAARTRLWIVWRKGSDVKQPFLRESAAAVGLVDYKICAVDRTWSAMLFARKKPV
jgi:CheY-like chemotaxis protein